MKNRNQKWKRAMAVVIAFAFAFTMVGIQATSFGSAATKAPTKITLKTTATTVDLGGQVQLSVKTVKPSGASKAVKWTSSNKNIAKVDSSGVVTGVKEGTVKVTATSKVKKNVKATIKIKVKDIVPTGISLDTSQAVMNVKETHQLTYEMEPVGVCDKGVTWSSSNEANVSVDNGLITAQKRGGSNITCTANEGGFSDSCMVVVNPEILNNWVMTGYWSSSKINNTDIDENAEAMMYSAENEDFDTVANKAGNILGNYVTLLNEDSDEDADIIKIVKYEDGDQYWDAGAKWVSGAGTEHGNIDEPVDDEVGEAMFNQDFRIAMGERLLDNYGIQDWSGTADWSRETVIGSKNNSKYYENTGHDWYNLKSNDTLTMLTNYKSELQTTGSTCVMSSALSVLEWYGLRGDLNERDLASLRGEDRAGKVGGTSLTELQTVFDNLTELGLTGKWRTSLVGDGTDTIKASDIKAELAEGHPVMVIWNSFGPHGQVIIGYDDIGTETEADDVLIMMDPYDTTDQNPDGYIVQSYERLAYGTLTWSDTGSTYTKFLSVYPESGWEYAGPVKTSGKFKDSKNTANFSDKGKMSYGYSAEDIQEYYPDTEVYDEETGLSGAAGVERSGDSDCSAYYKNIDFYNTQKTARKLANSKTLKLLDKFETTQQTTEWTCGCASALMCINWFGKNHKRASGEFGAGQYETDVSLATHRQGAKAGATTIDGMNEIFEYMESEYNQKWVVFDTSDLDDPTGEESYIGKYCLQAGDAYKSWYGLIPYLIENGIPVMIGSDEWGGHWQVVVGYDGMGTAGTQDDVLVIADPYDTTDSNQDGYVTKGFERLVYGWGAAFDEEYGCNDFVVAIPKTKEYSKVIKSLGF